MAQLLYRPRGNNEMKKSAGECFRAADNQSVIFREMEELAVKLSF